MATTDHTDVAILLTIWLLLTILLLPILLLLPIWLLLLLAQVDKVMNCMVNANEHL